MYLLSLFELENKKCVATHLNTMYYYVRYQVIQELPRKFHLFTYLAYHEILKTLVTCVSFVAFCLELNIVYIII